MCVHRGLRRKLGFRSHHASHGLGFHRELIPIVVLDRSEHGRRLGPAARPVDRHSRMFHVDVGLPKVLWLLIAVDIILYVLQFQVPDVLFGL